MVVWSYPAPGAPRVPMMPPSKERDRATSHRSRLIQLYTGFTSTLGAGPLSALLFRDILLFLALGSPDDVGAKETKIKLNNFNAVLKCM